MITSEHLTKYLMRTRDTDLSHVADTKPTTAVDAQPKELNSKLRRGHHVVTSKMGTEDMGVYDQGLEQIERQAGELDFEIAYGKMLEEEYTKQSPQRPKF